MTRAERSHIVWDWNGTLLNDIEATVFAASAAIVAVGGPEITMRQYGLSFRRPVRSFYGDVRGAPLDDAEWAIASASFSTAYTHLGDPQLVRDAQSTLAQLDARGWTQSLLSMAPQAIIEAQVSAHALDQYFLAIDGDRGVSLSDFKAGRLEEHLVQLGLGTEHVVVVGDSVDDGLAADAVGCRALLVATTHDIATLARGDWQIVADLGAVPDACEIAASRSGPSDLRRV